ncbi:MAG TPA: 1,4-alpha-glucan branching protein domain-containing protein [Fibrobacteria bacterium]|nr:1,4-alpha-glucan branching protein domain-containing protein [Fibrobacteria bacterium]
MGYLNFVLHAHLPYVRHPEHARFLEEDWFFEAITETYIPLLQEFEALARDHLPFKITMSLTPPLCEMLSDELLQTRYINHINRLRELAEKECTRTKNDPAFCYLAAMYRNLFETCHKVFNGYDRNLLNGFRKFQKSGNLEIITCGATHGFLPNLRLSPRTVEAQLAVAVNNYWKHFGQEPWGIWLGECGYFRGLDKYIKEAGLRYFFVDTHGILQGDPPSPKGNYAPVETPNGAFAFARDQESSKAVWSAEEGYPGDFRYREFYRDIGFDLDMQYIGPYIHPMGLRINTGIKYFRITGKGNYKEPYVEDWARQATEEHSSNFIFNRDKQDEWLSGRLDTPACIVCPYDAELFGHWWYEGPMFLGKVMRKVLTENNHRVRLSTPRDYLMLHKDAPRSDPAFSSWGAGGYADVWLNGSNDWIYPHLHKIGDLMHEVARLPDGGDQDRRARNQMARELLLAQSSDWAFIMKTGTMVDYAVKRTKVHVHNCLELYRQIRNGSIYEPFLRNLEATDNIFPEIDYKVYA